MKLQLIFGFLILFLGTVVQACAQQEEHAPFPATQLAENLRAIQVQEHVYVIEHRFPWPCNSMVVFLDSSKVLIADTPCCPEAMGLVLDWINEQVADPDITVINTHYHIDCLGGNELLVERGITVYGSDATMQLIDEKNDATEEEHNLFTSIEDPAIRAFYENFTPVHPNHVFLLNEGLRFTLAGTPVEVHYPGHAHTIDNVIVYPAHAAGDVRWRMYDPGMAGNGIYG